MSSSQQNAREIGRRKTTRSAAISKPNGAEDRTPSKPIGRLAPVALARSRLHDGSRDGRPMRHVAFAATAIEHGEAALIRSTLLDGGFSFPNRPAEIFENQRQRQKIEAMLQFVEGRFIVTWHDRYFTATRRIVDVIAALSGDGRKDQAALERTVFESLDAKDGFDENAVALDRFLHTLDPTDSPLLFSGSDPLGFAILRAMLPNAREAVEQALTHVRSAGGRHEDEDPHAILDSLLEQYKRRRGPSDYIVADDATARAIAAHPGVGEVTVASEDEHPTLWFAALLAYVSAAAQTRSDWRSGHLIQDHWVVDLASGEVARRRAWRDWCNLRDGLSVARGA